MKSVPSQLAEQFRASCEHLALPSYISLMALDPGRQDEMFCADHHSLFPRTRLISLASFLRWLLQSEAWPHSMPYRLSDLLQHTPSTPCKSRAYLGPLFSVPAKFHLWLEGRGKDYFKSSLSSPYFTVGRGLASFLIGIIVPWGTVI